jgi:uncharacterized protein (TIGR02118 family)
MSVSYFVRYDIPVPDLPGFVERYRNVHVPLAATWPGLQRMVIHAPLEWKNHGEAVLMAQLEFDSEAAMHEAAKHSESFDKAVTREAMKAEEVWRSPWLDGNEEQA